MEKKVISPKKEKRENNKITIISKCLRILKNKTVYIPLLIILTIAIILTILAIIKPEIKVGFIKTQKATTALTDLNTTSEYPEFKFESPHILQINNNGKVIKNYKTLAEDFKEGSNTISYAGTKDLFFIKLISKNPETFKINVDRIKPQYEIIKEAQDFSLLEENSITIKAEKDTTLKIVKGESIQDTLMTGEEQTIPLATESGDNTIQYYLIDQAGNETEKKDITYKAFISADYTKEACGNIIFPLNNALQKGVYTNSSKTTLYENNCDANSINLSLAFKGAINPCSGPCDSTAAYITIESANTDDAKYLLAFINAMNFQEDRTFVNNAGIEGRYLNTGLQFSEIVGSYQSWIVILKKDGREYLLGAGYIPGVNKTILEQRFTDLYMNFIIN